MISPDFSRCRIERLDENLDRLRDKSMLIEQVFVQGEEVEGPLLPFESYSPSHIFLGIRDILHVALSPD